MKPSTLYRYRPPRWLILTLLVLAIEISYIFIISAGTFTHWSTWTSVYDLQAEGFRAGHLYIPIDPPKALLDAPNPFDPALQQLWFWDASLNHGHFYFYWGPLPALGVAAVKAIFRLREAVGDQYPVFVFYSLYLVAGVLLIDRMARRLFDRLPMWLVVLAILVFAYANPTPFELGTPGVYEAAIAAGQAFLLAGMVFAFDALWRDEGRPEPRLIFFAAGLCWSLGIACRVSIAPAVGLIVLATTFAHRFSAPESGRWLGRARVAAFMSAPILAAVLGLLVYNRYRFDGWFDFGVKKQLSTMGFRTSWSYIYPNVYSYLVRPLIASCRFPFVNILRDSAKGFPHGYKFPLDYWTPEPLAGMLAAAPWTWLFPLGVWATIDAARAVWRNRNAVGSLDRRQLATLWCVFVLLVLASVNAAPTIALFIATMRYVADVSTGILLFSTWGAWTLYARCDQPWQRRMMGFCLVALAATTILFGVLLGFQGYDKILERHNPALYERLARTLSFCGR